MKISKIIFTLRKSSGVPFFSLKIFIEKSVRAPLVTMRKNFLLKKNVFQYVPTTNQNLKKNLLWFQKYLGKTDFFLNLGNQSICGQKLYSKLSLFFHVESPPEVCRTYSLTPCI